MRNTENYALKTCIRMSPPDYGKIARDLLEGNTTVHFDEETGDTGIWIENVDTDTAIPDGLIYCRLAEYFGVKDVTDVYVTYGDVVIEYEE